MNAIIRHLTSGEHFLARLDDSGDATQLSAPLAIADEYGRDWRDSTEAIDWEPFGYADLEPIEDEDLHRWTADKFAIVGEV